MARGGDELRIELQFLGRGGCHAHYSWNHAPPGRSTLDAWFNRILDELEEMAAAD